MINCRVLSFDEKLPGKEHLFGILGLSLHVIKYELGPDNNFLNLTLREAHSIQQINTGYVCVPMRASRAAA